jgi:hypothetical protein
MSYKLASAKKLAPNYRNKVQLRSRRRRATQPLKNVRESTRDTAGIYTEAGGVRCIEQDNSIFGES